MTGRPRKWKRYWTRAADNLVQVEEPNPAGRSFLTIHSYDVLNHLTQVTMPRPTGTQVRTFSYGNPPGAYLLSATNPENGTVTYTYENGRVKTRKDARNVVTTYTYSGPYLVSVAYSDGTKGMKYYYGSDDFAQYGAGRLTKVEYGDVKDRSYTERYSYTVAGQMAKKRLVVTRLFTIQTPYYQTVTSSANVDASWEYDNEGRMTKATAPTATSRCTAMMRWGGRQRCSISTLTRCRSSE